MYYFSVDIYALTLLKLLGEQELFIAPALDLIDQIDFHSRIPVLYYKYVINVNLPEMQQI